MTPRRLLPLLAFPAFLSLLPASPATPVQPQHFCPGCGINGGTAFGDGFCDDGVTYAWVLIQVTARPGTCHIIDGPYAYACLPLTNCGARAQIEICTTDPVFGDMCVHISDSRDMICGDYATFAYGGSCGASASITIHCMPCAE